MMPDVPLFLALAAGVVAAVNPCGFALLPAYLSLLVVGDEPPSRSAAVGRALVLTAAMTGGFVAVFGVAGLLLAPLMGALERSLPWFTVGFGALLAGLGGWLLAGRALPSLPWRPARAPRLRGTWWSMALFGAAYALASLSCTVGPFLAIVGSSARSGSAVAGVGLFLGYALGMGLVVGALAMAVALARASLVRRLRRAAAATSRAGGGLLVLAGAYVAWYGRYETHALARPGTPDPVVAAGTSLQQHLAGALSGPGLVVVVLVFAALVAVGALARAGRRPARAGAVSRRAGRSAAS